ncbi:MAG: ABC-2 family transporter protein [Acidobacteria bacterium]|nr:ABC-2 family transporter protein [Acidobacteriota bacterium]
MRKHVELLVAYAVQFIKVRLAYRADFLISTGASMLATAFAFGFLVVLFQKVPQLAGWKFEEVLFLYGFSLIPFGLFNVVSLNLYNFGNDFIIEGKFDRVLLRPVASLYQVIFEVFRIESLHEVVVGLLGVWLAASRLKLAWGPLEFVLLFFFALCGAVIYVAIFLMLTCVSFWVEDRVGVHPPVWNLIAFGRYPLSIYSGFVQFLLSWIIPFGFATYYPSVRLLGRPEFRVYAWLVPVVAATFLTMAIALWNRGVREYSSTGS